MATDELRFQPQPNTYYISGTVEKNIFPTLQYPDNYGGSTYSGSLNSGINRTIMLAESTSPTFPLIGGGDSKIDTLSLGYHANNIDTKRNYYSPDFKIYPVTPSLDITEGELTIKQHNPAVFCSYVDENNYFVKDDFSGYNVGFQDREDYTKKVFTSIYAEGYVHYTIGGEELFNMFSNMGYFSFMDGGWFAADLAKRVLTDDGNNIGDWETFELIPNAEKAGTYRINSLQDHNYFGSSWPIEKWIAAGAVVSESAAQHATQYNIIDVEFLDRVTQFNSIFNFVSEAPDAEDIKAQTVGDTGDNTKFFVYSKVGLDSSDKLTGGASANFTNFWENFSGTEVAYSGYFGATASGTALPQTCMASIDYLPKPYQLDIGASGTDGYYSKNNPILTPEMEVVLKFDQLKPALVTNETYHGSRQLHLNRGFTMIFSQSPPMVGEDFYSYLDRVKTKKQDTTGVHFYIPYGATSVDTNTVIGIPFLNLISGATYEQQSLMTGNDPDIFFVSGGQDPKTSYSMEGNNNYFELPVGEWVTLRFAFGTPNMLQGGEAGTSEYAEKDWVMAYSPDVTNDGAMQCVKLELGDGHFGVGSSGTTRNLQSCSFWLNNMRAVDSNQGDTTSSQVRNTKAEPSGYGDDDMVQSVKLDSISFKDYNWNVKNAFVNNNNPLPSDISIPKVATKTPIKMVQGHNPLLTGAGEIGQGWWGALGGDAGFGISGQLGEIDNYYGLNNGLVHSNICLGFDDLDTLLEDDGAFGVFLQGFQTTDEQRVNPINSKFISGSITSGGTAGIGAFNWDAIKVGDNDGPAILLSGGTNQIDNLTQKGFITVTGMASISGSWEARENIFAAARVIGSNVEGTEIMVDNPAVFDMPLGEADEGGTDYVMWKVVNGYGVQPTDSYADMANGAISAGFSGSAGPKGALFQTTRRQGNVITLNRETRINDAGTNVLCTSNPNGLGYTAGGHTIYTIPNQRQLGNVFISPRKHWLTLNLFNVSSSTYNWGQWENPSVITEESPTHLAPRHYTSAFITSGSDAGTLGTTSAEWLYTDGVYSRKWNLSNTDGGVIKVNTDYGFGAFQPTTATSSAILGGFIARTFPASGQYVFSNLDAYVKKDNPEWDEPFNFALYPYFENSDYNSYYDIHLDGRTGPNPPYLIWGIQNKPPTLFNLKVQPSLETISTEDMFSLAPNNLSIVKLTWDESNNEDIWYRMVLADTVPIFDKYHKASFYAHLNSGTLGVSGLLASGGQGYMFNNSRWPRWSPLMDSATATVGNTTIEASGNAGNTIEGFMGYGVTTNGASGTGWIKSATNTFSESSDKFGVVLHCRTNQNPAGAAYAASGTILGIRSKPLSMDVSGTEPVLKIAVSNNRIIANVGAQLNAGNRYNNYVTSNVWLSGTSYIAADGIEPTMVALTYDGTLTQENWKLYVNGALEDTATYVDDGTLKMEGSLSLGCSLAGPVHTDWTSGTTDEYSGLIEEVVFYNGVCPAFAPEGSYELDTRSLRAFGWVSGSSGSTTVYDENSPNTFSARVFGVDYHNIRGSSPRQIGMSNAVNWRQGGI